MSPSAASLSELEADSDSDSQAVFITVPIAGDLVLPMRASPRDGAECSCSRSCLAS
jgi:hypothetical protein